MIKHRRKKHVTERNELKDVFSGVKIRSFYCFYKKWPRALGERDKALGHVPMNGGMPVTPMKKFYHSS